MTSNLTLSESNGKTKERTISLHTWKPESRHFLWQSYSHIAPAFFWFVCHRFVKQANVIFETSFLVLLVVKQILSATTRTTSVYTSAIWYIILLSGCCSWLHFGNGSVFFLVIFQVLSLEFIIKRHSSRFRSSDSTTVVATFIRSSLFSLLWKKPFTA